MANEQIVKGKAYRILSDATQKLWSKISFWTAASDVEFNDGKNAEFKVGNINGITDSLESTSSNIAASAKAVSDLNGKLHGLSFGIDEDGNYGFVKEGADSVTPFKQALKKVQIGTRVNSNISISLTSYKDYKKFTLDNFCFGEMSFRGGGSYYIGLSGGGTSEATFEASYSPSLSYDQSTGVLQVSGMGDYYYSGGQQPSITRFGYCSANIYLLY